MISIMFFSEDDHEVEEDDHEVFDEDNREVDEDDSSYYEPGFFDDSEDEYGDIVRKRGTEILSMQDICLRSISKNLSRFNSAFSTTEDSIFQRNLLFLQRVHSSYLIKLAIRREGKLDESYLDFLLNQYIKEFNLGLLYNCKEKAVIKRMSEIGYGFQKVLFDFPLYLNSECALHFVNKIVCHLPNVKILNLHLYCNDSTLEIIASSCLQLKELHIDGSSVTNKGLKSLCNGNNSSTSCLQLTHISLSSDNCYDGISHLLQNMPSLEVVAHPDLPHILHKLHKESWNNTLERKYNLTSLYLGPHASGAYNSNICDILDTFTEICPHIKDLSLPFITKEQLDLCFKFAELEKFSAINNYNNQNLDLNDFFKSKGGLLRKLHLEKFTLSVAALIQNCPKLESLTLENITFQSLEPGVILQPLNSLRELRLDHFNLNYDALIRRSVIDILHSSHVIENLTLSFVTFEDNEEFVTRLSKFCENETFKHLKFIHCDVNDAFLQSVLLTCSNLETLSVEFCDNITSSHRNNLIEIANSVKSKTKIIFLEPESVFDSDDDDDSDIFDYAGYVSDEFDNDDYDPYDSDNLYYGYDDDF